MFDLESLAKKIFCRRQNNHLEERDNVICAHEKNNMVEEIFEITPTKKNYNYIGENWLITYHDNQASEHGEDGMIRKIFEILQPENKWVCEFGAHDPEIISNTWRLINKEGWNALLIEADEMYYDKLQNYYKNNPSVSCVCTKVSYEGECKLDNILKKTNIPINLDFMVIDIDGNDYHVWEAIDIYKAKVVMIEFNASIPIDVSFVQLRDMSINQGTSLKAMVELAEKRGYKLVAVTTWNAFFVQDEYFHLFFDFVPKLEDMYAYPAKHPIWMKLFQLYDGTIRIAGWNEMLWHKINLQLSDYQVLPASYRTFSRDLASQENVIEKNGTKRSAKNENNVYSQKVLSMPGNVLGKFASNVFSRYGEDGILDKLIAFIQPESHCVVEVGAWDGARHSNVKNLIKTHKWNTLLLENDVNKRASLVQHYSTYDYVTVSQKKYGLLDEELLDVILRQYNISKHFEVLLLNVYGMEYYLWESLSQYRPKILAIQFNPTIQNDVKFVQQKSFDINQGCSLRALVELGNCNDYELIAVTLATAIFIDRKYYYRIFEQLKFQPCDLDDMFCPLETKIFQTYDGQLFTQGLDRLLWNGIKFDAEKLQVVPSALRKFHQYADCDNKEYFYRV